MSTAKQILIVGAFVLLLLAVWPPATTRVHPGWLGLAAFVASWLLP